MLIAVGKINMIWDEIDLLLWYEFDVLLNVHWLMSYRPNRGIIYSAACVALPNCTPSRADGVFS
jgi:hypothetical protein